LAERVSVMVGCKLEKEPAFYLSALGGSTEQKMNSRFKPTRVMGCRGFHSGYPQAAPQSL
jgi:hypothetical protein